MVIVFLAQEHRCYLLHANFYIISGKKMFLCFLCGFESLWQIIFFTIFSNQGFRVELISLSFRIVLSEENVSDSSMTKGGDSSNPDEKVRLQLTEKHPEFSAKIHPSAEGN